MKRLCILMYNLFCFFAFYSKPEETYDKNHFHHLSNFILEYKFLCPNKGFSFKTKYPVLFQE